VGLVPALLGLCHRLGALPDAGDPQPVEEQVEGESGRGRFVTPTATDVITAGTEVMLGPREWILEEPGVVHTVRNAGDEPLVLFVSALTAADQPLLQPMEMDKATPAA
jgi:oxalate decarboxylase/phosphoglucose isomerase-like protein (cupin superfamily)